MNLTDLKGRFFPGKPDNSADPAHAFGSEEQVMAAFSQQTYTPPQPRPRSSILSGLRQRLNRSEQPRQSSAPVYSVQTYSQPAAPDLGWEAAFNPRPEPQPAEPQTPLSPEEQFRAFRDTVYSSPARPSYGNTAPYNYPSSSRPAPIYEEIGGSAPGYYAAPSYARPVYEEITLRPEVRREAPAAKPVYEEIRLQARPERETTYAKPVYEEIHLQGESSSAAEAEPDEQLFPDAVNTEAVFTPERNDVDPACFKDPAPAEQPPRPRDMQYFFWSGSIVAGTLLTLFAFIYACTL